LRPFFFRKDFPKLRLIIGKRAPAAVITGVKTHSFSTAFVLQVYERGRDEAAQNIIMQADPNPTLMKTKKIKISTKK